MLFSLGQQIVYKREIRTRKPPDALTQWRTMEVQRNYVLLTENSKSKRDGVLPVEARHTGRVSGPVPQKGPPQATGGHPVPMLGTRLRRWRVNAIGRKTPDLNRTAKPLSILRWNAEGVHSEKVPLTEWPYKEDIDVACIQEEHLNTNHRFSIRGYQTFRLDREWRHKGGVLILAGNNIAASDLKVDTNQQAKIHGVNSIVDNSAISILNLCCSPWQRSLRAKHKCTTTTVGDFNSHSTSWGYGQTDRRRDEVEDWQINSTMLLSNHPEDPPTFFLRRWIFTSTPDLALATEDLSRKKKQSEGPEPVARQRPQTSTTGNQLAVQAQQPRDLSQMELEES